MEITSNLLKYKKQAKIPLSHVYLSKPRNAL